MTGAERKRLREKVWNRMHKDYRGTTRGKRSVLVLRKGTTTLVGLDSLTDDELRRLSGERGLGELPGAPAGHLPAGAFVRDYPAEVFARRLGYTLEDWGLRRGEKVRILGNVRRGEVDDDAKIMIRGKPAGHLTSAEMDNLLERKRPRRRSAAKPKSKPGSTDQQSALRAAVRKDKS